MKYLLVVIFGLSVFSAAQAGQEPADSDQLYVYLFMNSKHGIIEHYRFSVPDNSTCDLEMKNLELGPHSRAAKFCTANFERAGSAMFEFNKPKKGRANAGK